MFRWLKHVFSPRAPASEIAPGGRLYPESLYVVTVDERGVVCRHPSGEREALAWDDLDAVVVDTNDTGPWGIDVWWLLLSTNGTGGCAIPQGATGEKPMLRALQALPGFDNESLIAAMSCTDNRTFLCWRRPADGHLNPET